jgi:NAD(P)-dependent dehydrogenase (short-subunit alcohol dehydrogenase family)
VKWTHTDIPDQSGRRAIVTGANTGIGFETARALATKGAGVILACRDRAKGDAAAAKIAAEKPQGSVEPAVLDLADLDSVGAFARAYPGDTLDLLINNAGVMMCPESTTRQGHELQFGVNHLGHFALTVLLLPRLLARPGSRVVTVSSQAHRRGKMVFDDLNFKKRGYSPTGAYAQSKLANLLFTFELQRRLKASSANTIATAAHPGWTGTDLQRHSFWIRMLNPLVAMSPEQGAILETRGYPRRVSTADSARNPDDAKQLWKLSEEMTGSSFAG